MDRRVVKTKRAILNAYFQLLREKPDRRITVAELTRRADIDRKTFYLHYGCIEDILDNFCDETVQEFLNRLDASNFLKDTPQMQIVFETLNETLAAEMDNYHLLSLHNYHAFWAKIHNIMVQSLLSAYADRVTVSREMMKLYCDFFVAGMIRLYQAYLAEPTEETTAQMKEVFLSIAAEGASNLFKKNESLKL